MDFIMNYYLLIYYTIKGPSGLTIFNLQVPCVDVCKNLKANNRKQTFKTHTGEKKRVTINLSAKKYTNEIKQELKGMKKTHQRHRHREAHL